METDDIIRGLAAAEGRRVRKFRDPEDERVDREDAGLPLTPLLHIARASGVNAHEYSITSSGEAGHPNEDRMAFIKQWLLNRVLIKCEGEDANCGDPCGTFRIELHDSFTYLPRADEYRDVLSFGRGKTSSAQVALLPDPYQASGYAAGGMLGPRDVLTWASKSPTVIFAGSSTGSHNAFENERIRACVWARNYPMETDFRITAIVQMRPYEACQRVPCLKDVIGHHVPPEKHFRHRFIANIVGNTACWSRVPMVLRSNSVLFHLKHDDITWYYPQMCAGEHYIACTSHSDILEKRLACIGDDRGCVRIAAAANRLFQRFLTADAADTYTRKLLFDVRGK